MASRSGCPKGSGKMIDVDEILDRMRMYNRVILFAVAVVGLLLALWLLSNSAGRREVGTTLTEIKQVTKTNERRADEIIDAAKLREEAAKRETGESIRAVSDDHLSDVLAGLLADYRREHGGR